MNIKVAVVTLLLGLGAIEAMAQPGWYRPFAEVSPYDVVRILRARGLVPVSRPARIGPNYVVQAADRNGHLKRVVVDAGYGDIVRVISLNRPPPPPAPPGPVVPKPDASEQPMSKPDVPAAEAPKAAEPPPVTAVAPAPRVVVPGAPAARPESAGESRGVALPTQPPARAAEPPAASALPPVQPLD